MSYGHITERYGVIQGYVAINPDSTSPECVKAAFRTDGNWDVIPPTGEPYRATYKDFRHHYKLAPTKDELIAAKLEKSLIAKFDSKLETLLKYAMSSRTLQANAVFNELKALYTDAIKAKP